MARFVHCAQVEQSLHAIDRRLHRHAVSELVYALSPGYRVERDDRLIELAVGDLLVFAPNESHRPWLAPEQRTTLYVLQWQAEPDDPPIGRAPLHDADGRLLMLLHWLGDLDERDDAAAVRRREGLLQLLLDEVLERGERQPISFADRVLAFMRRDYRHRLGLADFAGALDVSVSHLIRRFRQETGTTPGQALIGIRVERALHLLVATRSSLADIAEQCGFASVSSLSRRIRAATGRPPSAWRDRH